MLNLGECAMNYKLMENFIMCLLGTSAYSAIKKMVLNNVLKKTPPFMGQKQRKSRLNAKNDDQKTQKRTKKRK